MGGSMGMAVGEAFIDAVKAAIKAKCPYIIFTAAGGARMQEGILSPHANAAYRPWRSRCCTMRACPISSC